MLSNLFGASHAGRVAPPVLGLELFQDLVQFDLLVIVGKARLELGLIGFDLGNTTHGGENAANSLRAGASGHTWDVEGDFHWLGQRASRQRQRQQKGFEHWGLHSKEVFGFCAISVNSLPGFSIGRPT